MRIRNLTGKAQNIGHGKNSPEYLPDSRVIELIDQAREEGYTGVRFNWAFDSMCPEPGMFRTERLLMIVRELAYRGMFIWPVHGSGPYPNQPKWVEQTQTKTWHGCLPPRQLWYRIHIHIEMILRDVWDLLVSLGHDPRQLFGIQIGNEHGDGGVGDPTRTDYTKPKNGTGVMTQDMAWLLEFFIMNVNTLGMPLIGPGMECQAASAAAEIHDLLSKPWMRRCEKLDVHCYRDIGGKTTAQKLSSIMSMMAQRDEYIGPFDPSRLWVGETGGKGDPRQECQKLLALGVDAVGWLG